MRVLPGKPLAEVLCVSTWMDTYPTLVCTFVSLHGCGWQLQALVPWKRGFLLFCLAFLSSRRHTARETLRWPALTWHQREHGCACRHQSATQPWCWDKGSRRARALLSEGRVTATQLEVAGMVYGAGTVQMRRNHEVGVIRMGACDPHWEGAFRSVGSGWPLFCCRSHSAPSGLTAAPQPVSSLPGQGPREAFWRKENDVIVWKTWSVSLVCLWASAYSVRTLPG